MGERGLLCERLTALLSLFSILLPTCDPQSLSNTLWALGHIAELYPSRGTTQTAPAATPPPAASAPPPPPPPPSAASSSASSSSSAGATSSAAVVATSSAAVVAAAAAAAAAVVASSSSSAAAASSAAVVAAAAAAASSSTASSPSPPAGLPVTAAAAAERLCSPAATSGRPLPARAREDTDGEFPGPAGGAGVGVAYNPTGWVGEEGVLRSTSDRIVRLLPALQPQHLSNIVWAMAKLQLGRREQGLQQQQLLRQQQQLLRQQLQQQLQQPEGVGVGVGVQPASAPWGDLTRAWVRPYLDQVQAHLEAGGACSVTATGASGSKHGSLGGGRAAGRPPLGLTNGQQFADILWGLASLGVRPSERWLGAFFTASGAWMDTRWEGLFEAELAALRARVGHRQEGLVRWLERPESQQAGDAQRRQQQADEQQADEQQADEQQADERRQQDGRDGRQRADGRAVERRRQGGGREEGRGRGEDLSLGQCARLIWSVQAMRVQPSEKWMRSLEATLQPLLEPAKAQRLQPHAPLPASRSRQALPQELSMLLYSFASLRIRPQPHILDLVLRAAADVDEQMCSQAFWDSHTAPAFGMGVVCALTLASRRSPKTMAAPMPSQARGWGSERGWQLAACSWAPPTSRSKRTEPEPSLPSALGPPSPSLLLLPRHATRVTRHASQSQANTLWALAVLDARPPAPWLRRLLRGVARVALKDRERLRRWQALLLSRQPAEHEPELGILAQVHGRDPGPGRGHVDRRPSPGRRRGGVRESCQSMQRQLQRRAALERDAAALAQTAAIALWAAAKLGFDPGARWVHLMLRMLGPAGPAPVPVPDASRGKPARARPAAAGSPSDASPPVRGADAVTPTSQCDDDSSLSDGGAGGSVGRAEGGGFPEARWRLNPVMKRQVRYACAMLGYSSMS
ncbi:MAG: hypothetical protein WDW36_009960 [Sanguina aurantia]